MFAPFPILCMLWLLKKLQGKFWTALNLCYIWGPSYKLTGANIRLQTLSRCVLFGGTSSLAEAHKGVGGMRQSVFQISPLQVFFLQRGHASRQMLSTHRERKQEDEDPNDQTVGQAGGLDRKEAREWVPAGNIWPETNLKWEDSKGCLGHQRFERSVVYVLWDASLYIVLINL